MCFRNQSISNCVCGSVLSHFYYILLLVFDVSQYHLSRHLNLLLLGKMATKQSDVGTKFSCVQFNRVQAIYLYLALALTFYRVCQRKWRISSTQLRCSDETISLNTLYTFKRLKNFHHFFHLIYRVQQLNLQKNLFNVRSRTKGANLQ